MSSTANCFQKVFDCDYELRKCFGVEVGESKFPFAREEKFVVPSEFG